MLIAKILKHNNDNKIIQRLLGKTLISVDSSKSFQILIDSFIFFYIPKYSCRFLHIPAESCRFLQIPADSCRFLQILPSKIVTQQLKELFWRGFLLSYSSSAMKTSDCSWGTRMPRMAEAWNSRIPATTL